MIFLPVATLTLAVSARVPTGSVASRAVSPVNARRRNKLVQFLACQLPTAMIEALMKSTDTIDQAQKICKMYVFLNKDLDPSHVSAWTWDPVLTPYWFNSGSVTLASTLPPCASSTGAAVASTTGSATDSSATTTGSVSSGQTQTASRSMTSSTPHSCLFHLFTYLIQSARRFYHRPQNQKAISLVFIPIPNNLILRSISPMILTCKPCLMSRFCYCILL